MRTSIHISLAIALFLLLSTCDSANPVFYTINTTVNPAEAGTITPISGSSFEENTTVQVTATPNTGWLFVRWEGGLTGTQNPLQTVIASDLDIVAVFERQQFTLTVFTEGDGNVGQEIVEVLRKEDYPYGATVQLTARPASLWRFDRWEGDLTGTDNPATVIMLSNINVTAVFIPVLPLEGLLAYYPFNGNANDEANNGHDGAVMGATPTADRFGTENSAYLFDGIDDYIDIGKDAALKVPFPATVTCWVRLEFAPNFIGYGIFTNNFDEHVNNGVWMAISSTRRIAISYGNGNPIGRSSRRTKIGMTELDSGVWYHVVGVIRNQDDMSLYVNGINDGGMLEGGATALMYSEGNGNFGRRGSGVNTDPIYFQGAIDDLAFYNRELTVEEITTLYNSDRSTLNTRKRAR